jgi:hypothetical protein
VVILEGHLGTIFLSMQLKSGSSILTSIFLSISPFSRSPESKPVVMGDGMLVRCWRGVGGGQRRHDISCFTAGSGGVIQRCMYVRRRRYKARNENCRVRI